MEDKKKEISTICDNLKKFLIEKNIRYGNSALEPIDIFDNVINNEKDIVIKGILIRLLDKLKRIKNSNNLRKNDVIDIMGYFTLICIQKKWTDLTDLID